MMYHAQKRKVIRESIEILNSIVLLLIVKLLVLKTNHRCRTWTKLLSQIWQKKILSRLYVLNYARDITFGTILCHNSPHSELWLVRVCFHMTHWHILTNHNSLYSELWYKIMSKVMSRIILKSLKIKRLPDH